MSIEDEMELLLVFVSEIFLFFGDRHFLFSLWIMVLKRSVETLIGGKLCLTLEFAIEKA